MTLPRYSSYQRQPIDENWNKIATKAMKGKGAETLIWNTPEGFPVKPLYTQTDRQHAPADKEVGSYMRMFLFISVLMF